MGLPAPWLILRFAQNDVGLEPRRTLPQKRPQPFLRLSRGEQASKLCALERVSATSLDERCCRIERELASGSDPTGDPLIRILPLGDDRVAEAGVECGIRIELMRAAEP